VREELVVDRADGLPARRRVRVREEVAPGADFVPRGAAAIAARSAVLVKSAV
jgi:hypothetical protein